MTFWLRAIILDTIVGGTKMLYEFDTPLFKMRFGNRDIDYSWGAFCTNLKPTAGIKRNLPRTFGVANVLLEFEPT